MKEIRIVTDQERALLERVFGNAGQIELLEDVMHPNNWDAAPDDNVLTYAILQFCNALTKKGGDVLKLQDGRKKIERLFTQEEMKGIDEIIDQKSVEALLKSAMKFGVEGLFDLLIQKVDQVEFLKSTLSKLSFDKDNPIGQTPNNTLVKLAKMVNVNEADCIDLTPKIFFDQKVKDNKSDFYKNEAAMKLAVDCFGYKQEEITLIQQKNMVHDLMNICAACVDSEGRRIDDRSMKVQRSIVQNYLEKPEMQDAIKACKDQKFPEEKNFSGWTLLHFAAEFEMEELFQTAIKSGADVNSKSTSGQTPLHRAAFVMNFSAPENENLEAAFNKPEYVEKIERVKTLVANGADENIEDVREKNPVGMINLGIPEKAQGGEVKILFGQIVKEAKIESKTKESPSSWFKLPADGNLIKKLKAILESKDHEML